MTNKQMITELLARDTQEGKFIAYQNDATDIDRLNEGVKAEYQIDVNTRYRVMDTIGKITCCYDADGNWLRQGSEYVDAAMLEDYVEYVSRPKPKKTVTTDYNQPNLTWEQQMAKKGVGGVGE